MLVDTHHHFWNLEREAQSWMTEEHAVIRRTFEPADLAPFLERVGVERTVLVQSACSDLDTDFMFEQASQHAWIGGVIAWLDLRSPDRAARRLEQLRAEPRLKGFRHLIHNEPDPHWILQATVRASLASGEFIEVYVKVSIEAAAKRDPKGLYKKAMAGEIRGFTGVDDPYEEPDGAEVVVETERVSAEEGAGVIVAYLERNGYLGGRMKAEG